MLLGLGLGVMRGERERPPLRGAYWLLVAIYLIASLGHAELEDAPESLRASAST